MNKFSLKVLEAYSEITRLVGESSDTAQGGTFHWTLAKEENNVSVGIDFITNNNIMSLDIVEFEGQDYEARSISNDTLYSLIEHAGTYGIEVTMNGVLLSKDNNDGTFEWKDKDEFVGEWLEEKIWTIAHSLKKGKPKKAYKIIREVHEYRKGLVGDLHKIYVFEMTCDTLFSMAHDYEKMESKMDNMAAFACYTLLGLLGMDSAVEKLVA